MKDEGESSIGRSMRRKLRGSADRGRCLVSHQPRQDLAVNSRRRRKTALIHASVRMLQRLVNGAPSRRSIVAAEAVWADLTGWVPAPRLS